MNELILFIMVCCSLTFLLKESDLFSFIRSWIIPKHPFFYKLFSCSFCLGFYTGIISFILVYKTVNLNILVYALASCIINLLFFSVLNKINS